jgi:integrase
VHLEILVEELSAEAALRILLPKIMRDGTTHALRPFQGKPDLIRQLPARLRAYARWAQSTELGVVVLIDEDRQDCKRLKADLEDAASAAGVPTKSSVQPGTPFVVLNRLVVEELEAWFLGDCDAIRAAYPRVPDSIEHRAAYRRPDEIRGGTWEALERILRAAGYYKGGCPRWRWPSSSRRTSFPLGTALRASGTSAPAFAL